jgi:hypothetical protein
MTDPKAALGARRDELLRERERLQARVQQLDDKLRALDLIMNDPSLLGFMLTAVPGAQNGAFVGMGLRQAIRAALAEAPHPAKPIEITERLLAGGYRPAGEMNLKLRVSQEMHRMMRLGQLKRLPSGRYRLVEQVEREREEVR